MHVMGSATYFARAVSYTHEMFTKLTTGDILIKTFFLRHFWSGKKLVLVKVTNLV